MGGISRYVLRWAGFEMMRLGMRDSALSLFGVDVWERSGMGWDGMV